MEGGIGCIRLTHCPDRNAGCSTDAAASAALFAEAVSVLKVRLIKNEAICRPAVATAAEKRNRGAARGEPAAANTAAAVILRTADRATAAAAAAVALTAAAEIEVACELLLLSRRGRGSLNGSLLCHPNPQCNLSAVSEEAKVERDVEQALTAKTSHDLSTSIECAQQHDEHFMTA
jgi:hypothetical protein